jgi:hypothetical protein
MHRQRCEGADWIHLAQCKIYRLVVVNTLIDLPIPHKAEELLDQMNNFQIFNKILSPCTLLVNQSYFSDFEIPVLYT